MSKYISLSARNHQRVLWAVAVVFFFVLSGFGGLLMQDLPGAGREVRPYTDFIPDSARYQQLGREAVLLREAMSSQQRQVDSLRDALNNQNKILESAQANLNNFIATRQASEDPRFNAELVQRNNELERLRLSRDAAQQAFDQQNQELEKSRLALNRIEQDRGELERLAYASQAQAEEQFRQKAFFARLLVCVPLVLLAGFAWARYRKGQYWPFVYGFVGFALFSFFVELGPYIPTLGFGKYAFHLAALGLTIFGGLKVMKSLNEYLAKQKVLATQTTEERKAALSDEHSYDASVAKIKKGLCPSCEKPIGEFLNASAGKTLHCPHCGFGIKTKCKACGEVKNSLTRFCTSCGAEDAAHGLGG